MTGRPAARLRRRVVEGQRVGGDDLDARVAAQLGGEHALHVGIALDRQDAPRRRRRARERRRQRPEAGADLDDDVVRAVAATAATMRASTVRSWRKFCPHDFFAARPWRASTRRGSSRSLSVSRRLERQARDRPRDRGPARTPRSKSCVPAAAIIAALSVQYLGGGMWSAKPSCGRPPPAPRAGRGSRRRRRTRPARSSPRAPARAATCAPARRRPRPGSWRKSRSAPAPRASDARRASSVATAVLSPEKLKSRSSRPGSARGSDDRPRVAGRRQLVDRDAARIAEPQHLADLVERLARRVVARRAEQPRRARSVDANQRRVPARHQQRQVRIRRRRRRRRVARGTRPPGGRPGG